MKEANNFQKVKVQPKGVSFWLFFSQPGVAYKKACGSIELLIGFINSRSSHWRYSTGGVPGGAIKIAEHLQTTASVILSFQYTLFIGLSIFTSASNTYGRMDFQSES